MFRKICESECVYQDQARVYDAIMGEWHLLQLVVLASLQCGDLLRFLRRYCVMYLGTSYPPILGTSPHVTLRGGTQQPG